MPRGISDAFMDFWSFRPRHCRSCGRRFYERYEKNKPEGEGAPAADAQSNAETPDAKPAQPEAPLAVGVETAGSEPAEEARDNSLRCPYCFSRDIGYTRQRTTGDAIMAMLRRTPKRCRACNRRFYVARWAVASPDAESEPSTIKAERPAPVQQDDASEQAPAPVAEADSEAENKGARCPRCASRDLAISVKRGLWDGFLGVLHYEPRRCRVCTCRFHTRAGDPQEQAEESTPAAPVVEPRKPVKGREVAGPKPSEQEGDDAAPGMPRCPRCRSKDLARPLRSGFGGALQATLRREPRVCRRCARHFYVSASSAQPPTALDDSPSGETPET